MSVNKIAFVGIPTAVELVSAELLSFVNDGIKTLYVINGDMKEEVNGYNYFIANNFNFQPIAELTEADILNSENPVVAPLGINIFHFGEGIQPFPKRSSEKLVQGLKALKDRFPNVRIAFCTFGSPFFYDNAISNSMRPRAYEADWPGIDVSIINTKTFVDNNLENFYQIGTIMSTHLKHGYRIGQPYDRSGLFFPNPNPEIPTDTYTSKTFEQIVDETALTFAGKNPIVAWSGGIDSTLVVAAFVKNNIDFKVTVGKSARFENPELYDYFIANYNTIAIPDNNDLSGITEPGVIVSGFPCDNLWPEIHTDFIPGTYSLVELVSQSPDYDLSEFPYLMDPVDPVHLYNNVKERVVRGHSRYYQCSEEQSSNYYDTYLQPIIDRFPFEVNHYYQFKYFMKFIFCYYRCKQDQFINGTNCVHEVYPFFDTDDFQRWSITNLDYNFQTYCMNYKTEKMPSKQYSYSVFGLPSILELHKYPSVMSPIQQRYTTA